jgi:hypothetical protein
MFPPTRVKNNGVNLTIGGIMKRIIGILLCLMIAIAMGLLCDTLRDGGVTMVSGEVLYD